MRISSEVSLPHSFLTVPFFFSKATKKKSINIKITTIIRPKPKTQKYKGAKKLRKISDCKGKKVDIHLKIHWGNKRKKEENTEWFTTNEMGIKDKNNKGKTEEFTYLLRIIWNCSHYEQNVSIYFSYTFFRLFSLQIAWQRYTNSWRKEENERKQQRKNEREEK